MTDDEASPADEPEEPADEEHGADEPGAFATERTTAPQSPYTGRDVAVGALVAAVGVAFTVVVPFLLA